MFSTTSVMRFVFVLCIWTSHVLTVTDENRERCIFPILLVNVLRSYRDNASLVSTLFSHFFEFLHIFYTYAASIIGDEKNVCIKFLPLIDLKPAI